VATLLGVNPIAGNHNVGALIPIKDLILIKLISIMLINKNLSAGSCKKLKKIYIFTEIVPYLGKVTVPHYGNFVFSNRATLKQMS